MKNWVAEGIASDVNDFNNDGPYGIDCLGIKSTRHFTL